jgi:raffinose/stachyose/melibiose transport system substrate-binding protein
VKSSGKSIFGLAGSVPQNPGILAMMIASSTVYGPNQNWNADRSSGKTTFDGTQGWHQALQAFIDLNKSGCFQEGAAGAGFDALTNGASQGKMFGFFAPSGATKDIMDAAGGHVKLVALAFPAPQGLKTYITLNVNVGLAGNKKTKSPKLVEDFIKFSVSPAEAKKFADAQGSIPVGSNVSSSDLLPQYQPVADLFSSQQYRPFGADTWPNGQVYDALGTGATGLLTGQKSIDDVLKSMDAAWGS